MAHIAVLVQDFPPAPAGGLQLQAEAWARELGVRHRVTVVTRREPRHLPLREERDGYTVLRQPCWVPNLGRTPRLLRRIAMRIQQFQDTRGIVAALDAAGASPDLLLCFMTLPTGRAGVQVGRRLGIPAVVWVLGQWEYELGRSRHQCRDTLRVWEGAAGVLVQSPTNGMGVLGALDGFAPRLRTAVEAKLAVVGNGVDLPVPAPLRPSGPVLTAGRLVRPKGMDVVITACAQLDRPLVVAGSGPELPALKAQAGALGARVRFTGFLDRASLDDQYREASAVVLASEGEGLPNVVLEAMAHQRPVVTTPVGGIPDLLEDGVNGLLVPPGDADALASALARLAADPDLAGRLARAGRATAEQYGWTRAIPALDRALEHLVGL